MSAVSSTVMRRDWVLGRDLCKTSSHHGYTSTLHEQDAWAEIATAGFARMAYTSAVPCAKDELSSSAVLLNVFLQLFRNKWYLEEQHRDHAIRLSISRQLLELKELHQLTMINHGGHMLLQRQPTIEWELPDYSYATDRLQVFLDEEENWDGCGGLPASPEVAVQVQIFLSAARNSGIVVPSLAMGGDGSVAVVWKNESYYISADFDGSPEYSFFVSHGDDYLKGGVCSSETLDSDWPTT